MCMYGLVTGTFMAATWLWAFRYPVEVGESPLLSATTAAASTFLCTISSRGLKMSVTENGVECLGLGDIAQWRSMCQCPALCYGTVSGSPLLLLLLSSLPLLHTIGNNWSDLSYLDVSIHTMTVLTIPPVALVGTFPQVIRDILRFQNFFFLFLEYVCVCVSLSPLFRLSKISGIAPVR